MLCVGLQVLFFWKSSFGLAYKSEPEFSGKTPPEIVDNLPPKGPKKGKKWPFATACFPDIIFLPNSTQVLTKFLPNFTPVEDGQNLLITFLEQGSERLLWRRSFLWYGHCGSGARSSAIWITRVADSGAACWEFVCCALWILALRVVDSGFAWCGFVWRRSDGTVGVRRNVKNSPKVKISGGEGLQI